MEPTVLNENTDESDLEIFKGMFGIGEFEKVSRIKFQGVQADTAGTSWALFTMPSTWAYQPRSVRVRSEGGVIDLAVRISCSEEPVLPLPEGDRQFWWQFDLIKERIFRSQLPERNPDVRENRLAMELPFAPKRVVFSEK